MRLHYQSFGDGFPLLVLHGLLGSSDNWRAINQRLADRFNVHSLDLRNHGASPHCEIMDYGVMSRDVCEFLDQQKLFSAFLLGHSMGGKVAMQCAVDFPNRVAKLIVVDIAPRSYEPSQQAILNAAAALDPTAYGSFGEMDSALAAAIPEAAVRQLLLKNLRRDSHGRFAWKAHIEAISRCYDNLTAAIVPRQLFYNPTCFVRGGHSDYIREDDIPKIQQIFPQVEIKTIANAGHWVHADAAEQFLDVVVEFLARH